MNLASLLSVKLKNQCSYFLSWKCLLKVQYFFASSNYVILIIDTDNPGYYLGHVCGYKIQGLDI